MPRTTLRKCINAGSQGRGKPHKLRLEGSSPSPATNTAFQHSSELLSELVKSALGLPPYFDNRYDCLSEETRRCIPSMCGYKHHATLSLQACKQISANTTVLRPLKRKQDGLLSRGLMFPDTKITHT